ncbi:hypothetical protein TorRG33x02_091630 [Trema orientale]|uniref:Uncharacterized protein n=1 Tax=Trema orientale TaxID=63057 RepID=A0A2P5FAZ9_TREOI|nr:hypothetical protein TorRG33x02_091630 [Trema orientale]
MQPIRCNQPHTLEVLLIYIVEEIVGLKIDTQRVVLEWCLYSRKTLLPDDHIQRIVVHEISSGVAKGS